MSQALLTLKPYLCPTEVMSPLKEARHHTRQKVAKNEARAKSVAEVGARPMLVDPAGASQWRRHRRSPISWAKTQALVIALRGKVSVAPVASVRNRVVGGEQTLTRSLHHRPAIRSIMVLACVIMWRALGSLQP